MNYDEASKLMSPDIYDRFRRAVEIGKWPDGNALTNSQKEICLQAIMLYEAKQNVLDSERVGYVDKSRKKAACAPHKDSFAGNEASTIRILH